MNDDILDVIAILVGADRIAANIDRNRISVVEKPVLYTGKDGQGAFRSVTFVSYDGERVYEFQRPTGIDAESEGQYNSDIFEAAHAIYDYVVRTQDRNSEPICYTAFMEQLTIFLEHLTSEAWEHPGIPATNQPSGNPAQLNLFGLNLATVLS